MFVDFESRSNRPEKMDDPSLSPRQLERTLRDLAALNDQIWGHRPTIDGIEALVGDRDSVSILDVGTGFGDVPRRIADWGARQGVDVQVTGIDLSETTVECARRHSRSYDNIEFRRCNLFELADDEQYDIVHAALMLHHLDDAQIVDGLRAMYDASRLGMVINDLHRHPIAYFGSHLLLRMLSENPVIHHDGALSILRAFTGDELREYCRRAHIAEPRLRWWPLFRWQLIAGR